MKVYTDYPFYELGDEEGKHAPIRSVNVLSYDGNKYCKVQYNHIVMEVKLGYLYSRHGRYGDVPSVNHRRIKKLYKGNKNG